MSNQPTVVGEDEIEDARALIAERGFTADDFEISQSADDIRPGGIRAVTGRVQVTRRSARRERAYEAGNASPWLTQLETDLAAGVFGRP